MKTIGNVLWFVLAGIWLAIGTADGRVAWVFMAADAWARLDPVS